ncbi:unnamed protein product, partial [marine sediment metagenome]
LLIIVFGSALITYPLYGEGNESTILAPTAMKTDG